MAAVRKDCRKAMGHFSAATVQVGERNSVAAFFRHAHQATIVVPEDETSLAGPGASHGGSGGGADRNRRAAGEVDLLEFFPRVESQELAVRRPERRRVVASADLRAEQKSWLERVQRLDP